MFTQAPQSLMFVWFQFTLFIRVSPLIYLYTNAQINTNQPFLIAGLPIKQELTWQAYDVPVSQDLKMNSCNLSFGNPLPKCLLAFQISVICAVRLLVLSIMMTLHHMSCKISQDLSPVPVNQWMWVTWSASERFLSVVFLLCICVEKWLNCVLVWDVRCGDDFVG